MEPATNSPAVSVRAPTRIDLGGGWTDVPPYSGELGGFVCNIAINRYATATVTSAVNPIVKSAVISAETYRAPGNSAAGVDTDDSPLIAAAVRRAGVDGVRITVRSDFPVGAGLGGSSSASAAILGALRAWRGMHLDLADIAEEGRRIEVEDLGISGGRQDHYAATHGGALALTFTDRVKVRRLRISAETRAAFETRALLVYTGESRISGSTVKAVLDSYRAGDTGVLAALAGMKSLAARMADALEQGDIDWLGSLLAEHWSLQRSLHSAIPTPRIDEIIMRAHAAGAIGWKAMGASGGGCVLVLARVDSIGAVRNAVAQLGEILLFTLDTEGLARVS